jgi:hypothetical protein
LSLLVSKIFIGYTVSFTRISSQKLEFSGIILEYINSVAFKFQENPTSPS